MFTAIISPRSNGKAFTSAIPNRHQAPAAPTPWLLAGLLLAAPREEGAGDAGGEAGRSLFSDTVTLNLRKREGRLETKDYRKYNVK